MTTLRIRASAIEHNLCAIRQRTSARIIAVVKEDGYGLGLYVVKTILSQHKEQITVTSENGVTAFSFTVQMAHPMRNEP